MVKLYEEYIDYVALIQQVWNVYNPQLEDGTFKELTPHDRWLIKKILSKMDGGNYAANIAVEIPNEVETLKHCIKVYADHANIINMLE